MERGVGLAWDVVLVIINHADERVNLLDIGRRQDLENSLNLVDLGMDALVGKYKAKEFSFMVTEGGLDAIDLKVVVMETLENCIQLLKV